MDDVALSDIKFPSVEINLRRAILLEYLTHIDECLESVVTAYIHKEENESGNTEEIKYAYEIADDYIPNLVYSPALLSIYAFYEKSFDDLLNYAREKEGLNLGIHQLSNTRQKINRCNLYLSDVLKFDFQIDDEIGSKVNEIIELRNFIAHTGGYFHSVKKSKEDKIKGIVGRSRWLSISSEQLVVKKEFLMYAFGLLTEIIDDFINFMVEIYVNG